MSSDTSEAEKVSMFERIRYILLEPSDAIVSDVVRVKAKLLSFSLLLIVIVLPAVQIVLDILFENMATFLLAILIFIVIYIISRTKYVVFAGITMTLTLASMPYLFLLVEFNQSEMRLTLNLIIWPVIAALFGSQWLTSRVEALFISGETLGLVVYFLNSSSIAFSASL